MLTPGARRARRCTPRRRPATSRPRAGVARGRRRAGARATGGPHRWEPLLYLAYSRRDAAGRRSTSRALLLDHGADPNAGFLWDGLPSPFTALTGAFGRGEGDPPPHADALALARILLEAGADPTDTQATYNLHWTEDDAWLELLLEFGYGRGDGGPWHARLAPAHPTPRETAEDCLMWAALEGFPRRVAAAARRRRRPRRPGHPPPDPQGPHGARGRPARRPHRGRADVLRAAGAREPELERAQRVEAAYMAADGSVTDPPPPGLIARAAAQGNAAGGRAAARARRRRQRLRRARHRPARGRLAQRHRARRGAPAGRRRPHAARPPVRRHAFGLGRACRPRRAEPSGSRHVSGNAPASKSGLKLAAGRLPIARTRPPREGGFRV